MVIRKSRMLLGLLAMGAAVPVTAQQSETGALRAELEALRADYDARIQELEQRLALAEQRASAPVPQPAPVPTAADSSFNPSIGIIFQGQAWDSSPTSDAASLPGFPLGGEAGPKPQGLAIGETEIDISANVDDKFTAWLTAPIVFEEGESGIEIEEAWLETLRLPAGLSARFGRFMSGVGYLNDKHSHAWDFADQPLAYQAFLGDQYIDDGIQLRWIAPLSLFVETGAEMTRGERFPAAGAARSGRGARSLYVNFGGDVGVSHSWLAGISYLDATAIDRVSGDEDEPLRFTGDSKSKIAEFVWKWAPNGNWRQRNFIFQSEYIWNDEAGIYSLDGLGPLPYDNDREGWYAQAVYQPIPRWRVGSRIDVLSLDDPGLAFSGTPLAAGSKDPRRYTLMADWSNSEFSRVRLQYSRQEVGAIDVTEWGLQYLHSIGAHGAHSF